MQMFQNKDQCQVQQNFKWKAVRVVNSVLETIGNMMIIAVIFLLLNVIL